MARIAFRNFTGGEVTPTLSARYDLQKFGTFLQCCQNFVPNLHGDIERRPGTRFVAELGKDSVLIPFQFNSDKAENFALIFQVGGTIRVASEDGLLSASMEGPYTVAEARELSVAQVGDVVYLAHKNYGLRKLTRSGAYPYTWGLSTVVLNKSLAAPGAPTATWHRGPKSTSEEEEPEDFTYNENYTLRYVVTALDADGVESVASAVGSVKGRYPTDWVQGDYVQLSWSAVSGATEYNVYRESAGYYGFIGVSKGVSFQDQNYEPDTAQTPKENWNPFANGNNPATVTFHQQRMVIGGTKAEPATFYMSRTGDYESFRKSRPLQDDDPVEYMLASGSIDEIKWVASFGGLLIGSSGAEYEASSSGAAITPSDVTISTESYWGSSGLQPLIIGNSIMHCQRSGNHVRDLAYSWEQDGYSGTDLSLLAPQLVEGHQLKQWAYQQSPGSVVWIVRDDGMLLALTYMKEQNVFGWSRHVTDGKVRSVCSLSGDGEDVIMLVVERGGKFFLERMASRFDDTDSIEQAFFVDCGKTVTNSTATTTVSGFDHLEGREVAVLADGSPEMGHVVKNGKIELYYPAKVVTAGLNYSSVLVPLPIETDGEGGSTLGKRRGYGKCVLRLYRSVGGSYAATRDGDLYNVDAWKDREFYDLPFLPENFGEAVQPFSGNIEVTLPSGQDADTSIILKQDRPMPFRVIAITADVDVAEQ